VNYDFISSSQPPAVLPSAPNFIGSADPSDWAQNIANLQYDPRPPVFVMTNPAYPRDFRFYVDINRNGRFETNGYIPTVTNESGALGPNAIMNGEPEFIGVLANPSIRTPRPTILSAVTPIWFCRSARNSTSITSATLPKAITSTACRR